MITNVILILYNSSINNKWILRYLRFRYHIACFCCISQTKNNSKQLQWCFESQWFVHEWINEPFKWFGSVAMTHLLIVTCCWRFNFTFKVYFHFLNNFKYQYSMFYTFKVYFHFLNNFKYQYSMFYTFKVYFHFLNNFKYQYSMFYTFKVYFHFLNNFKYQYSMFYV